MISITISNDDDIVWQKLINAGLNLATHIEFNVLFQNPGAELDNILLEFDGRIVKPSKPRYYWHKGLRVSIPNNSKARAFLLSKKFEEWTNTILEDPSLVVGDKEILGSISHEYQIGYSSEEFD